MTRSLASLALLLAACGATATTARTEEPRAELEASVDASTSSTVIEADATVDLDAEAITVAGDDPEADAAPDAAVDPSPETPDLVAMGRRAYVRHCESCHEDGPRIVGRALPIARVRRQVREGGRRMRAIPPSRLSERDLRAICEFLHEPRR